MEPSKHKAKGHLIKYFVLPFLSCEGGMGVRKKSEPKECYDDAGKEKKKIKKTFLVLFSSTSNTGSVQDYFQEILKFPQLIKLWQHPRKL